jgi:competence protein ComEC
LWGLAPLLPAGVLLALTPVPDVLVTGDGRHVGITGEGDRLLVLRETKSDFTAENLRELAGTEGEALTLDQWPGAQCSPDFCVATLRRGGRDWHLLMARSHAQVSERALAAACERADIAVSDRYLSWSCHPAWLKIDRDSLRSSGGLAIYLAPHRVRSVADSQGKHGWWKGGDSGS